MSQSKDDADYTQRLTACETLQDLRALMALYRDLAVDAGWVVAKMSEADFTEFRLGLKSERKGRFAGEAWAKKFSAVLMPLPMLRISQVADEFKAPFHVTYKRIQDLRPDLLVVEPESVDAVAGSTE